MHIFWIIYTVFIVEDSSIAEHITRTVAFQSLLFDKTFPRQNKPKKIVVNYYLSTRSVQNVDISNNIANLTYINKTDPVKFIVHGWLEHVNKAWYRHMRDEYLTQGTITVIQTDWSRSAAQRYDISAKSVRFVGARIGRFIVNLNLNYQIPLKNIHIIGHSLGAHVSGFAGKEVFKLTGKRIFRITALDAAAPLFEEPPFFTMQGLERTDARIVDAIHTDAGVFGYRRPIGTVDFYPNGGKALQPGCPFVRDPNFLVQLSKSQTILDDLDNTHYAYYEQLTTNIASSDFQICACFTSSESSSYIINTFKLLWANFYRCQLKISSFHVSLTLAYIPQLLIS